MNQYEKLSKLTPELFLRRTGIKKTTFGKMIEILTEAELKKNALGGRPSTLSLEERLLLWLEYMREYRTYFHVGTTYGMSESSAQRICVWIEDALITAKEFQLPSRKRLLSEDVIEVVVVDATESPVERPKKSKENTILARKSTIPSRHSSS
jgi:hypothetical protein